MGHLILAIHTRNTRNNIFIGVWFYSWIRDVCISHHLVIRHKSIVLTVVIEVQSSPFLFSSREILFHEFIYRGISLFCFKLQKKSQVFFKIHFLVNKMAISKQALLNRLTMSNPYSTFFFGNQSSECLSKHFSPITQFLDKQMRYFNTSRARIPIVGPMLLQDMNVV